MSTSEDVKPDVKGEGPDFVAIRFFTQFDGTKTNFKVKKSKLWDKVIQAYCDKKGLDKASLRFRANDGDVNINPRVTIESCDFEPEEDGVVHVNVFKDMEGGSW
eukprot:m.9138 g.9138  ORF g.9138 m.9138 type:complete len:104 (-) comp4013_c0_seq1:90-401(-)